MPYRSLVFLLCLLAPAIACADQLTGRVVAITDGDTITIRAPGDVQEHIRLAGIDAPEKRQPYGQTSKRALSDRVFGRQVTIEWRKRDRYGRIVGKVLADGTDTGLAQIEAGLAWHYKAYEREQSAEDRAAYAGAEVVARSARRGLWSEGNPVPPWEWRRTKNKPVAPFE